MSTSVTQLTSIVYELCEVEKDSLTDKEQYEAYTATLSAHVSTIKRAIFTQGLSFADVEEFQQFILHNYRIVTALVSLLEETVPKKENESSYDVLLLKEILTQIRVLNSFILSHFPEALKGSEAPGQQLPSIEKFKLDITAGGVAAIARAVVKSTPNVSNKSEEEIIPYMVTHFSSKKTDDLAITTFKKNYRSPEPADIKEAIRFLTRLIRYLRSL